MSRSPIFGRQKELDALRVALSSARQGTRALCLLSGEPGIGKTSLALEIEAAAVAEGCRCLWGRCWEAGNAPSLWPWSRMMRALLEQMGEAEFMRLAGANPERLSPMLPDVFKAESLPALKNAATADSEKFQFMEAVRAVLSRLAAVQPLLIVLEDLHAADRASLELLLFLARELRQSKILFLGTYRELEAQSDASVHKAIMNIAREGQVLPLRGLEREAVCDLVETRVGKRLDLHHADQLIAATHGNPLFIIELLNLDAAAGNDLRTGARVPSRIREAIAQHLATCSALCLQQLEMASIIGREFELKVLVRGLDRPIGEVLNGLDEACARGVVRSLARDKSIYEFRHDLLRQALNERLSAEERTRMHAVIGGVLEQLAGSGAGETLATAANHYFEAQNLVPPDKVAGCALRAGREAISRAAYLDAIHFLEHAQTSASSLQEEPERLRMEISLALGNAYCSAGEFEKSKKAFWDGSELAVALKDGKAAAEAALGHGATNDGGTVDLQLIVALQRAEEMLADDDYTMRPMLLGRLAEALTFSEDTELRDASAKKAVAAARKSNDPAVLGYTLNTTYFATQNPDNTEQRARTAREIISLARKAKDLELEIQAHNGLLRHSLELADIASADAALEGHHRLALSSLMNMPRWVAAANRAMRTLMNGDIAMGEHEAMEAFKIGQQSKNFNAVQALGIQLIQIRYEQGRAKEMLAPMRMAAIQTRWVTAWMPAVAWLQTEIGMQEEARSEIERLAATDFKSLRRDIYWFAGMGFAGDAAATLGDLDACRKLMKGLRPYEDRCVMTSMVLYRGSVARVLGRLAAAMDDFQCAYAYFAKALEIEQRMRARGFEGHVHFEWAKTLIKEDARRNRDQAGAHLQTAAEAAEKLGLVLLNERIKALVDETGVLKAAPPLAALEAALRQGQKIWTLEFRGKTSHLPHAKGMTYLQRLLAHPNEEVFVLDLANGHGGGSSKGIPDPAGELSVVRDLGDAGEAIDAKARKAYQQRLMDLREDLNEAEANNDSASAEAARVEIDALTDELSAAIGLGGRNRMSASHVERARSAVTKAIKAAIQSIAEADTGLGDYLAARVRTGKTCVYRPDRLREITWKL